ncbi:hypothetical protein VNO80_15959 [Phaseolus coccineus]|uniref:Uncharacterized protein n=1 Tax=Phaseolus coccineus TaxID=3886 RepID=A0AAN9ML82_PHACN
MEMARREELYQQTKDDLTNEAAEAYGVGFGDAIAQPPRLKLELTSAKSLTALPDDLRGTKVALSDWTCTLPRGMTIGADRKRHLAAKKGGASPSIAAPSEVAAAAGSSAAILSLLPALSHSHATRSQGVVVAVEATPFDDEDTCSSLVFKRKCKAEAAIPVP